MHIIIWEYQVKPEQQAEFEKIYAANGAWVELFKKGAGYLSTELFQKTNLPLRFLTIDRWKSKDDYEAFLSQRQEEYKALDAQCEGLTESEIEIGRWDLV